MSTRSPLSEIFCTTYAIIGYDNYYLLKILHWKSKGHCALFLFCLWRLHVYEVVWCLNLLRLIFFFWIILLSDNWGPDNMFHKRQPWELPLTDLSELSLDMCIVKNQLQHGGSSKRWITSRWWTARRPSMHFNTSKKLLLCVGVSFNSDVRVHYECHIQHGLMT